MIGELNRPQYAAWGFLVVPGLLSDDESRQLSRWIDEVAADVGLESASDLSAGRPVHHFEQTEGGARLARSERFVESHAGLRDLLTAGKLIDAASQLLGEAAVLYKEKINYKHPGGGGYAAHQDAPAFPFIARHLTCAVAVDRATRENGCLWFAPGAHRDGLLPQNDVGCLTEEYAETLAWEAAPLEAGDAVFFSSLAPHRSGPNGTEFSRRTLYLTYNALSEGNLREAYYQDREESLSRAASQPDGHVRLSRIGHFQGRPIA